MRKEKNMIYFSTTKFKQIVLEKIESIIRFVGSSDVWIFESRVLPYSLFTPHPLESHIERKSPHLLPYKL